jgi:hypothetical protein
VEGGPLLPVKTELYQSGLGSEALRALANLAHLIGKDDVNHDLGSKFRESESLLNQAFWSPDKQLFAFALDNNDKQVEIPTVLSTVPMWFNLLDEAKAESTINLLADADHETDWGMRIISSKDPRYNPGGYHFGSVWPLFTGWASVGEYRYHRALPAYANLRANALLALDGSLGHVTEVLSGDYFEPLSTSSPHQIWSAAMVVSPLLRGMLGLGIDATTHTISLSPHVPYNWSSFGIDNVRVGDCTVAIQYQRTLRDITLTVQRSGSGPCTLEFSPAASLHAKFMGTEVNGHNTALHSSKNSLDQHSAVSFPLNSGTNLVRLRIKNDFGLFLDSQLPPLAGASQGLRFVSESTSPDGKEIVFDLSGLAGHTYKIGIWNPGEISAVDGATIEQNEARPQLRVSFPAAGTQDYVHTKITVHFKR